MGSPLSSKSSTAQRLAVAGVVKPGSTCDVPVLSVDFYPTFLAAAGAAAPASPLDGAVELYNLTSDPG